MNELRGRCLSLESLFPHCSLRWEKRGNESLSRIPPPVRGPPFPSRLYVRLVQKASHTKGVGYPKIVLNLHLIVSYTQVGTLDVVVPLASLF